MLAKKSLGIYSGPNYLSLVEVKNKKLSFYFNTPHNLADFDVQNKAIPEEIKLTAILQRNLRDKKIDTNNVNLSLRTKDIILRSFFIPWMMPGEIKGVVEFEINRYIPFKLDELAYSYHSTVVKEDKTRRIRILFVAVRRDALEKYCNLLEQSGLKVVHIEPEPLSIVRLLTFKKIIHPKQITAIIQTDQREGTLIIVDDGVPQFVREFRLILPTQTHIETEKEIIKTRLFNEIRISLDYYSRQHTQNQINNVLFLSPTPIPELAERLGQDLGISIEVMTTRAILNIDEDMPLGILTALGAGLRNSVSFPVSLDISKSRVKESIVDSKVKPLNMTRIGQIAAGCGALILAVFLFSQYQIANQNSKIRSLEAKQGPYGSLTIDELNKKREDTLAKVETYKNVLTKSDIAFFMKRIPELLPEQAWLSNLRVSYPEERQNFLGESRRKGKAIREENVELRPNILMDGYIYTPDINEQIALANQLPLTFKNAQDFFKFFQEARLMTVRRENINEYTVTYFQINIR